MIIRRALLLVLAILWLWPASLHAQSEALTEARRQGQARYQAGRYAEAIPHFEKALALAEREFGPESPETALYLNNVGFLYQAQGRNDDAEPVYKRSLAIREKVFGPEHPHVARTLHNLA